MMTALRLGGRHATRKRLRRCPHNTVSWVEGADYFEYIVGCSDCHSQAIVERERGQRMPYDQLATALRLRLPNRIVPTKGRAEP